MCEECSGCCSVQRGGWVDGLVGGGSSVKSHSLQVVKELSGLQRSAALFHVFSGSSSSLTFLPGRQ